MQLNSGFRLATGFAQIVKAPMVGGGRLRVSVHCRSLFFYRRQTISRKLGGREVAPRLSLSPTPGRYLSEVLSAQQKASDEIAELNHSITAKQAELKTNFRSNCSADFTNRLLPNLLLTASPPSVPSPPSAQADPKPARKLAPPSKPQGPISVGGAATGLIRGHGRTSIISRVLSPSPALHTSVADIGAG